MNRFENWFCASSFWQRVTHRELLPWLLADVALGEHVLEVGAGAGAATAELQHRAARVTSLEYSEALLGKLVGRHTGRGESGRGAALRGDATALPFPEQIFSAVIAVLMLHHLRSREAQERAFAEAFRVLRPSGVFLAVEIQDSWFHRIGHIRSTFVPVDPAEAPARLTATGFSAERIAFRHGAFRMQAVRPQAHEGSGRDAR